MGCIYGILCVARGANLTWVGANNDGLWGSPLNWDAKAVPTIQDNVIINIIGGADVIISAPAAARSITVGGNFPQTLTLLSSLVVDTVLIQTQGTLFLSGNNNLPLSVTTLVTVLNGGLLSFQSGGITGPGKYLVESTGSIVFKGAALKEISNTTLTVYGPATVSTVQQATIQFTYNALFYSYGNFSVVGDVLFYSSDKSTNSAFVSVGPFIYLDPTRTCSFNVFSVFEAGITATAGGKITFENSARVLGTTNLGAQSNLLVEGVGDIYFANIQSLGTIIIDTAVTVQTLNAAQLTIGTAGSFLVNATSSIKSLTINGKIIVNDTVTTSTAVLAGGTVTGKGVLQVTDAFQIAESDSQATTSFISGEIQVAGKGSTSNYVVVLFYPGGNLHITSSGSFLVSSKTSFQRQSGNPTPVITNEGSFGVQLAAGGTFDSSVDYSGANGLLTFENGAVTFTNNALTANKVTTTGGLVTFNNAVVKFGQVTGTGSFSITTAQNAASTFNSVAIALFVVTGGVANVSALTVDTLNVGNGILNLGTGFAHTTSDFLFNGGTISGNATLTTNTLTITGAGTSIIQATQVKATKSKYQSTAVATVILQNSAIISIGY